MATLITNVGAVVFCSERRARDAIGDVLASVGYTISEDGALALELFVGDGIAVVAPIDDGFAVAVGRRLARRVQRRTRVLTARLQDSNKIACALQDQTFQADGTFASDGPWPREIEQETGGNIGELCDGKAYFAVSALIEDAREYVLPDFAECLTIRFDPPPALDSARLEEVARRIRVADQVEVVEIDGRTCVRTSSRGARLMSFVSSDELATLQRVGLIDR